MILRSLLVTVCLTAAADPTPHWTIPPFDPFPDQANSLLEYGNAMIPQQYDNHALLHPVFMTTREIGYCAGAHLDVLTFGSMGAMIGPGVMNMMAYMVMPDVITARMTGNWYTPVPINAVPMPGDGYCSVDSGGWTLDSRYTDAEFSAMTSVGYAPSGPLSGIASTVVEWHNLHGDLLEEADKDKEKDPRVRLMMVVDPFPPSFGDSETNRICSHIHCLRHKDVHYKRVLSSDEEGACYSVEAVDESLREMERELNEHVCAHVRAYKEDVSSMVNASETVPLYRSRFDRRNNATVKKMQTLLTSLENNGFYHVLGDGSSDCPWPFLPTKAEVKKVLQKIKPDYFVYIMPNPQIVDPDATLIGAINELMDLLDDIVPIERRFVHQDEGALLMVSSLLPTKKCKPGDDIKPTLAPDPEPTCLIGPDVVPPTDDSQKKQACITRKWRIIFDAVITGSTGGATIALLLYYLASGLDDGADLDDQLDLNDTGEGDFEAVLFAH